MTTIPGASVPGHGSRADACPGVLDLHEAADGLLARVRLPGGLVRPEGLRVLAAAAEELADGALDLTARGNVQLRGLTAATAAELAVRLTAAGLLASAEHDRARNIVASPLTGLGAGGHLDVRLLVRDVDAALQADPALADLPGRFLVAVDDGSGDVVGSADIAVMAETPGRLRLWLGGRATARVLGPHVVAMNVMAAASAFLALRDGDPGVWRVRELSGAAAALADALGTALIDVPSISAARIDPGVLGRTLVVGAVLGRLTSRQALLLADLVEDGQDLRITSRRSVVVPGAAAAAVSCAEAGLIVDAGHPLAEVTACSGLGECARALADVRADAVARGSIGRAAHWSACDRRCGQPAGALPIVALGAASYRVGDDPEPRSPDEVGGVRP